MYKFRFFVDGHRPGEIMPDNLADHVKESYIRNGLVAPVKTKKEKPHDSTLDLESMTKAQLIELGDSRGIALNSRMKKSELIEALL